MNKKLRMYRMLAGFSQYELAQLLGYTRGAYSHIECGHREMPDGMYSKAMLKMSARLKEIANLLAICAHD
jgi:transcriptional regulator with XRE-family HTH domain